MKFDVKQDGGVVAGLAAVPIENANLQRICPQLPLHRLALGEGTWGVDRAKEHYSIIRVE